MWQTGGSTSTQGARSCSPATTCTHSNTSRLGSCSGQGLHRVRSSDDIRVDDRDDIIVLISDDIRVRGLGVRRHRRLGRQGHHRHDTDVRRSAFMILFRDARDAMQSMVESSRRTRQSAPGTNDNNSSFSFS
jgi:hypothetical protein